MRVEYCHANRSDRSEHYFAYAVENHMEHGLPHADLVGPGIMIMSKLQEQVTGPLEAVLKACNIPLNRIPQGVVERTLAELPAYCFKHNLAFGLAHTL